MKDEVLRRKRINKVVTTHAIFHKKAGKIGVMINSQAYEQANKALDSGTAYAKVSNNVSAAIMALRRAAGI
jgi:hypothetical protein